MKDISCTFTYKALNYSLIQDTYDYANKFLNMGLFIALAEVYVVYNDNKYDVIKFGENISCAPYWELNKTLINMGYVFTEKDEPDYKQYSMYLLDKMIKHREDVKMIMLLNTRASEFKFYCTDKKLVDAINKDPRHKITYEESSEDSAILESSDFIDMVRSDFYKYVTGKL